MTARQLLERRAADLRAQGMDALAPPVLVLGDVLGDVELDEQTEGFLAWFSNVNWAGLDGLSALTLARDDHRRRAAAELQAAIALSVEEMQRAAMCDDAAVLAFTVGVAMRRLTDAAKAAA